MPDKNAEPIADAIERNMAVVLSLPSAGMHRNHKSRFLCEADDGILVEAPRGEDALIQELIGSGTPCRVTFARRALDIVFESPIRREQSNWRLNADTTVDALLLEFPGEIETKKRRSNYRAPVAWDSEISVRVWRLSAQDSLTPQPSGTKEVAAEIRDLSASGIGVKFVGKSGEEPVVSIEDRLRVALTHGGRTLVMEGKMRPPAGAQRGKSIVSGIQFKNLERDFEGRKTLAQLIRLVGQLQREELRRVKLGLSSGKA